MITSWDDNMLYLCILKLKGRTLFISFYFIISLSKKPDRHHTLPNIHLIIFDLEKKISS